MSSYRPILDLSLAAPTNTLPLAAYVDPDGWEDLVRLEQPSVRSFEKRCPRTVFAARGLYDSVSPGYTYGLEHRPGVWHTFIAGSPGWTYRWKGRERVGIRTGIVKPLLEKDIINSLCWHNQSVAVSTRDDHHHRRWLEEEPGAPMPNLVPAVHHVRFDLDLRDGWNGFSAACVAAKVNAVGNAVGLQTTLYSSGRRGVHAAFLFPVPVTNSIATAFAALIRECLTREVAVLAKVDADSTSSLLRLPGGNHASTMQCSLFIDHENRCFNDASQQANLIAHGLKWTPGETGSYLTNKDFELLQLEIGASLQILADSPSGESERQFAVRLLENAKNAGAVPLFEAAAGALGINSNNDRRMVLDAVVDADSTTLDAHERARHVLRNQPVPGDTYRWMTQSYGAVWACRLLHGEHGIEVLLDILRTVPAAGSNVIGERTRTARGLWKTFTLIPPKPRKRNLHPVDVLVVEAIVVKALATPRTYNHRTGQCQGKLDIRLLQNLVKVAHVLLYSMRVSGGNEVTLSSRNGSEISEKLFPGKGVARPTFERVRKLLEDLSRVRYERTKQYQLTPKVVSLGAAPLAPVFERQPGTTTRYKPTEWLIETRSAVENNLLR